MESRAGGAQVLLSSSCFLLLWHLNLFPCSNLPPALQRGQMFPGKRKRAAQERSLAMRIHPVGEQRAPHVTLPKENQKRHVRTERKPNCWDRQLQTNTPSRWDLTHGGWGRKGAPNPNPNQGPSLWANQTAWQPSWGWSRMDLVRGGWEKLRERI